MKNSIDYTKIAYKVSYLKDGCPDFRYFKTQSEFIEWIHNNEKLGMIGKNIVITKMESVDPSTDFEEPDKTTDLPEETIDEVQEESIHGIEEISKSEIPEWKDIQLIPEKVNEYLNSHKPVEILAFDFYDHRCKDRITLYCKSEEDLEKWIDSYPYHRNSIFVYHKDWIPDNGQMITIPPDTIISDSDKIRWLQ